MIKQNYQIIMNSELNALAKLPNIVKFNKELLKSVDVVFTALPNGEAQKISNLFWFQNKSSYV